MYSDGSAQCSKVTARERTLAARSPSVPRIEQVSTRWMYDHRRRGPPLPPAPWATLQAEHYVSCSGPKTNHGSTNKKNKRRHRPRRRCSTTHPPRAVTLSPARRRQEDYENMQALRCTQCLSDECRAGRRVNEILMMNFDPAHASATNTPTSQPTTTR